MATAASPRTDRRTEIADAALRIIATRGITALTTTSLAQELGVTSGALFRHFASREAILAEVVSRVEALFLANFPSNELPPRERLEQFMAQRAATAAGQAGVLRLMASEQFALALPPDSAKRLMELIKATQAFIATTIQDGADKGIFRSDIDAVSLSVLVMGSMQMIAFLHNLKLDIASDERAAKIIAGVHTLLAPPKASRGGR
jgi:AcrR family transcriptional regulator